VNSQKPEEELRKIPTMSDTTWKDTSTASREPARRPEKSGEEANMTLQPKLAPAACEARNSATLAMNEIVLERRRRGQTTYHFGFGQSPFPVHQNILTALREHAARKEYLPGMGLVPLRQNICKLYHDTRGYQFSPSHCVIGPGSKELIFQSLYCLVGPVLVPAPSWVSYGPQARLLGKDFSAIITRPEDDYKLRADSLDQHLAKRLEPQKILILNSPSNPTGMVYSNEEMADLAVVCRNHRVIVIADEIYSDIVFDDQPYASMHRYYPEGTMVTGGMSKGLSAGGYRLGFLLVPDAMDDFIKALTAVISETFSCVAAPIQYAAVAAYSEDKSLDAYIRSCRDIHRAAGLYLQQRFVDMGLRCPRPEGAFYVFPDFSPFAQKLKDSGISTSTALCNFLLNEHGIAMLPASDFHYPESSLAVRVATVDYNGEDLLRYAACDGVDAKLIETRCHNLRNGCDVLQEILNKL